MTTNDKSSVQIRNIMLLILVPLIILVFKGMSTVTVNIMLAVFIFMLFAPLLNAFEKAKFPSGISVAIVVFLIVAVCVLSFYFIGFSVNLLIRKLPDYVTRIKYVDSWLSELVSDNFTVPEDFSLISIINTDWLGKFIMPALRTISSSMTGIIGDLLVVVLMAIFLISERQTIPVKLIHAVKKEHEQDVSLVLDRIYSEVGKYMGIKTIVSAATGLLFFGISKLVGLDFAAIWGVLAFVLNFIPTIGSIVITVLTIFMSVIQFLPDWGPIIAVACGTVFTQMILGNIVEPKMQGSRLNLSPFVILVSLLVFGYIWGVIGMFLAVPMLSIMVIIFSNMESMKGFAVMLSSGKSLRKLNKVQ